jgi:hypothetical protein
VDSNKALFIGDHGVDCYPARIRLLEAGYAMDTYPTQIHIRYVVDTYPASIRKKNYRKMDTGADTYQPTLAH